MTTPNQRPNLFIVGAMKSGTSSLHSHLNLHPQVFMCEPKEPCFFVARDQLNWPAIEKLELWREPKYLQLFAASGQARYRGESSTLYTKAPKISGVPERIARFSPDARIVYVMRDPVERTISHYWHAVRWEKERRDLLTALQRESHFREVSFYAMQLRSYLRLFDRNQITTLTLEELARNPHATVAVLCSWLGLDSELLPSDLGTARNVTPEKVEQVRGLGLLERFRWSPLWEKLGPSFPRSVRSIGRRLALERLDRKSVEHRRAVEFLRPRQLEETAELSELLGRSFQEWTTLLGES